MNVGESAEEFMFIHALGRERSPALLGALQSKLLIFFFDPLGSDRELLCLPSIHQPPNAFLTEA